MADPFDQHAIGPQQTSDPSAPQTEHPPPSGSLRLSHGSDRASDPEPVAAQPRTTLPRRKNQLTPWVVLLGCLVVAAPALLIGLHVGAVADLEEARTVATSMQTFRHHGDLTKATRFSIERYEPYLNGRSQLDRPPGLTWLHMAVFAGSASDLNDVDGLVKRARTVSVACALLALSAVFWAGHSIGGRNTAMLSTVICAANPMFIMYGRLATQAMPAAALSLISVAAALWAIRPLRPPPSVERQFLGWLLCGLCMGAAIVTGGLWVILEMVLVVGLLLVLCPNRISHLLGLLAALLIGVLLVAPWGMYAHEHDADAWRQWLTPATSTGHWPSVAALGDQGLRRGLLVLAALLPWTAWLIGAVTQPLSTSSAGTRTRLFLGLVWFAALAALVLLRPGADDASHVLILLPAAAVMIGQLFSQYTDLCDVARPARNWRLLRWLHILLLAGASGAIPAILYAQPAELREPLAMQKLPLLFCAGLAAVLLGIVFLSMRWALKHHVRRSVIAWSAWMILLMALLAWPATSSDAAKTEAIQDLLGRVRSAPLFWLDDAENGEPSMHALALLYARREQVKSIGRAQLVELTAEPDPFYVAGPLSLDAGDRLHLVQRAEQIGLALWQHRPVVPKIEDETPPEEPEDGEEALEDGE